MAKFYDARGNTYFVATPDELRSFDMPDTAAEAALALLNEGWAKKVVNHVCADPRNKKQNLSNGLLLGPFSSNDGYDLLIVNTTGSPAERSGNGLTIFSQFLVDEGMEDRGKPFKIRIHFPQKAPIDAPIEPAEREGEIGFWVDMGRPAFGPRTVNANHDSAFETSQLNGQDVYRVFALERIEAAWTSSQFVSVGNPHCVTFLKTADELPTMSRLCSFKTGLKAIANGSQVGNPCKDGINLQWAVVTAPDRIAARVFERGEGLTESSGSSATAVASAARHLHLVDASLVNVVMPGGVAPVRFDERSGRLERVMLFGVAMRKMLAR
jgi:diaminopimelate epimerase